MSQNYMIINGEKVPYTDERNILEVVRKAGIDLPTFCYYSDLSIYGACRMCIVEDNRGGIITSCSTPPKNGMEIKTNTPKLHKHRKLILKLLLSSHCRECTTCSKSGDCRLQDLARRFGIQQIKFDKTQKAYKDEYTIDRSSPSITRDPNKCIQCGDCVRMCSENQNVGAIDFALRGYELMVCPAFDDPIAETDCVNCGQCAAVCPTAAIVVNNQVEEAWKAIYDKNKRVVVQIAPAVRVALGEEFDLPPGESVMPLIVAAMRKIGFDEIYDTSFSADLTVIEESNEFLEKLKSGAKLPLFTSCCPGWIKYVENRHPDLLPQISSCKSPMGMFSSVFKEYASKPENKMDDRETFVIAIMPCTAKKYEASREEFKTNGKVDGKYDTDLVLTTQELANMIWEAGVEFNELVPEASDMPFGMYSGAGVIFGVTGGVTEAVIRRLVPTKDHTTFNNITYSGVRGLEGVKVFEIPYGDRTLKLAVVSGLKNTEELIQKVKSGEEHYDFIEVMACPTGCIGGGGQPQSSRETKTLRAQGLYSTDKMTRIKHSDANPIIEPIYKDIIKDKAHELLHVHYNHK
ncbi:[FeFe] hydrogenase, group A [Anaerovorax odorimutans]|uniref:[FeFe] hydrogenase, group A n=1 Tax=Anaerovorax odorimutans TaxID=109327 RepID=UPI0004063631|nr:[FeFe] hydrogenase, group A [Anaerovorax odorimutans]